MKEYTIAEILSEPTRNGLTKPKAIRGVGVPMISMREIFAHSRIANVEMDRVPVTDKELESYSINAGDIVFARQSLTLAGAGKCSIITKISEPTVFESHLIRMRINTEIADPYYVYYYFNSYEGKNRVKSIVEQVAAAGIRSSDLVKLKIFLPSKDTQRRIAGFLNKIDTKIETNNEINKNLEQQIESLLQAFLDNKDAILVKLGDYLYIKGRIGWKGLKKSEYLSQSGYRIINGETLTKSGIDWNKAGYISEERYVESPEIMLQVGDILLSKDGTIGKIGYVDSLELPTSVASGIFVIRNNKPDIISTTFIYYLLKSSLFESFIAARTEGSVIPHLYQKDFMEFEFPLPSFGKMAEFEKLTEPMFSQIVNNLNENKKLVALRDALLPKLMSGELDVTDLDI